MSHCPPSQHSSVCKKSILLLRLHPVGKQTEEVVDLQLIYVLKSKTHNTLPQILNSDFGGFSFLVDLFFFPLLTWWSTGSHTALCWPLSQSNPAGPHRVDLNTEADVVSIWALMLNRHSSEPHLFSSLLIQKKHVRPDRRCLRYFRSLRHYTRLSARLLLRQVNEYTVISVAWIKGSHQHDAAPWDKPLTVRNNSKWHSGYQCMRALSVQFIQTNSQTPPLGCYETGDVESCWCLFIPETTEDLWNKKH